MAGDDGSAWRLERRGELVVALCGLLERVPGLRHAVSTRRGPGGVDVGPAVADCEAQREARVAFAVAAGLAPRTLRTLRQVHGARLVAAAAIDPAAPPEADGAVAGVEDGVAPAVRAADCVPLLLADSDGRAVAAVHAGWRGTAAGIAGEAVAALRHAGVPPSRLLAAIGPAAGACCYEVESELAERVARSSGVAPERISSPSRACRVLLDLAAANRLQLEAAGLPAEAISIAPWCSICSEETFHSYRRDGRTAGRTIAAIGWAGPPP